MIVINICTCFFFIFKNLDNFIFSFHTLRRPYFSLCIRAAFFNPAASMVTVTSVSSRVGNEETKMNVRLAYSGRALYNK